MSMRICDRPATQAQRKVALCQLEQILSSYILLVKTGLS